MFTHPALLRELNLIADLLRRGGEGLWSRRVTQAADGLRKSGWTAEGQALVRELYRGEPGLGQFSFGAEHLRPIGGPGPLEKANASLARHRLKLEDLMALPVKAAQTGPRPKSPDLGP
jgi:hypothetical protein